MDFDLDKIIAAVMTPFEHYWENKYIIYGSIIVILFLIFMIAIKTLAVIKNIF